jgi:hypothetical protein
MDLDDIFMSSYLNEFSEKEKKKILLSQEEREIAEQKKNQLEVIETFLQKFVDLDISVNHCHQYTKNTATLQGVEPQKFSFYLVDSSKRWAPGISIWFNHPAEVEIAIPNKIQEDGVVVIRVSTHHPDAYILEQKFYNFKSACEALGKFLGKCTTSIGKDPRQYMKEVQNKGKSNLTSGHTSNNQFVNNVPDHIPEDKKQSYQKDNHDSTNNVSLKKIGDLFNRKNKDEED